MSETDDTDILLLIPPNFFLVNSSGSEDSLLESSRTVVRKPVSCTAQVLGKLVDQVHSLESRLETLELDSSNTVSTLGSHKRNIWNSESNDSRNNDCKSFTFPRRRRRKLRKEKLNQGSLTSLDSVFTRESYILNAKYRNTKKSSVLNDSQSMDGDISSIVSTPNKKNDKLLLHEIDEFLTKVETYESPESKYREQNLSPENVIKATGEYISQKYDSKNVDDVTLPSGRIVPSDVLDKYIYLVKNNVNQSPQNSSAAAHSRTDNNDVSNYNAPSGHSKQDTKSPSIRRLNFSETKDVQPTSTPKRTLASSTNNSDSFKPSSNKIYERATKVLEHYKSQNYSRNTQSSMTDASDIMSLKKEEFKMPQMRPFGLDHRDGFKIDSIDTDLLSLSELWGEKGDRAEKVDNIKLEEERLKREHCEAIIQQLQRKILEQQEKLAVAIKVDRAKDTAISKLKEAWLRLTGSLDRAEERHRAALEKMVREVDNFKMVAGEAQKKTSHFETELYKALDLAHDYQEKCKQLTQEKKEIQDNMEKVSMCKDEGIQLKNKEIEVLKENYETVMRLNKQSTDCVKNLEDALEKEKSEHEATKSKSAELYQKVESLGQEKILYEQERDILKEKVNEERSRCNMLERQMCDSQNQISELLKKCDTLECDNNTFHKHLELQKSELKGHYQSQLEQAVLGKLREFQAQLDAAERDLQAGARSKEASLMETYSKQISRIEEQHKLEVEVLEEKQREEIKLYRLQLAQASERIGLLENKLESYRRRRGEIASQLHSVMENQWRQALLILTQTRAPSLDSTRAHSATPLPSVADLKPAPPAGLPPPGPLRARPRDLNFDSLSDHELQQYVKMLLTKPPNLDLDSPPEHQEKDLQEEPTSDRPTQDKRDRDRVKRALHSSKPPWKA